MPLPTAPHVHTQHGRSHPAGLIGQGEHWKNRGATSRLPQNSPRVPAGIVPPWSKPPAAKCQAGVTAKQTDKKYFDISQKQLLETTDLHLPIEKMGLGTGHSPRLLLVETLVPFLAFLEDHSSHHSADDDAQQRTKQEQKHLPACQRPTSEIPRWVIHVVFG